MLRQGSAIELANMIVIETAAFIRKRFFSTQNRMRCSQPEQRARQRHFARRLLRDLVYQGWYGNRSLSKCSKRKTKHMNA